jgi:hypothetical protein
LLRKRFRKNSLGLRRGKYAMTEAEWLACTDPQPMMEWLREDLGGARRRCGRRKLRLFACACLRGIWPLLRKAGSRMAVAIAERYADGEASEQELIEAQDAALGALLSEYPQFGKTPYWQSSEAAGHTVAKRFTTGNHRSVAHASSSAALAWAIDRAGPERGVKHSERRGKERKARQLIHSNWLRDVFGNPFRPIYHTQSWLSWNGGKVPKLAQAIYEKRAFDRLPILADALEQAGCTEPAILTHCRSGGEHVLGCWVVDLLLGRE